MGGSGGGGGFSSSDMSKMQEAADARLKALASKSTKVLFVCETVDRKSLNSHLARSKAFKKGRVAVIDASEANKIDNELDSSTFLVAFTDDTKSAAFIDTVIDKVLVRKIGGVHVQSHSKAFIPSKITAYRWRSITWDELEAIFS
jgi:hypothetical protein